MLNARFHFLLLCERSRFLDHSGVMCMSSLAAHRMRVCAETDGSACCDPLQVSESAASSGVPPDLIPAVAGVYESRQAAVEAANAVAVASISKLSLKDFDWSVRVRTHPHLSRIGVVVWRAVCSCVFL